MVGELEHVGFLPNRTLEVSLGVDNLSPVSVTLN